MKKEKFYQTPSDASRVKQAIVSTYFGAWKNVIKSWPNRPQLGYVDIYSGPGAYADQSYSTPLLILKQAVDDPYLADNLIAVFNDGDAELKAKLEENIAALPGINQLKNHPKVYNYDVSEEVIKLRRRIPTLLFADPWGYKGLSIKLIEAFLSIRGSDCILFFNYNRINAGLNWQGFDEPLDAVFGQQRAEALRIRVKELSPADREQTIVGEMEQALKEVGAVCVLKFRFKKLDRTSHHLLFASKHIKGCRIMKNIMSDHSSSSVQGLGSFEFSGAAQVPEQFLIPGFGPLDELSDQIAQHFAGKTLVFKELLSVHEHPTATDRNYKDAVLQLEDRALVEIQLPDGRERRIVMGKRTLPDDAIIKFLKAKKGENNG